MRTYEIVLDGELTADLSDPAGRLDRRQEGGATVLTVPAPNREALARVLGLLETLGIGMRSMVELEGPLVVAPDPE